MTDIEEIKRCLTHIARSKDSVSDLLPVLIKNITPYHNNSMDLQFNKSVNKLRTPTKVMSMNVLEMRQNIIYDDIKDIRREVESLRETVSNINSVVSILLSMNKPITAQQLNTIPVQQTPAAQNLTNSAKPIIPQKTIKSPIVKDSKISNNLSNFTSNPQNLEISKQLGLTATKGSTTLQFEKPIQLITWLKKYVPDGLYPKYTNFLSCVNQYNSLSESENVPEHLTWLLDWKLLPKNDLNFLFKLINDHFASSIANGKKGQTSIQEVNIPKPCEVKEIKTTTHSIEHVPENKTVEEEDASKDLGSKKSKFSNMWSDFRRRIYKKRKNVISTNRIMPSISSTFISKHKSMENPKKRPRSSSSINLGSTQTIHNIDANYKKFCCKEENLMSDEENEFIFSKPSCEEDKTGKYIGEVVAGLTEGLYTTVELSVWTKCLELSLANTPTCLDSLKNNSLYNGYLSLYFPCLTQTNCLNSIIWDRLSSHQRIFFLELLFIIIKVSDGLPDNVQTYFDAILPPYDKVVEKIKIFMVTFGCDSLENLGTKVGSELTKSYSEPSISLVLSLLLDCLKIDFELPENSKAINYMGPVFRKFRFTSITQSITPFVELVVDILNSDSIERLVKFHKFSECSQDDLKELYLKIKDALKTAERNFFAAIDSSFDSDNDNHNKENAEIHERENDKENVENFPFQKAINRSSSVNKRKILQPQKIL